MKENARKLIFEVVCEDARVTFRSGQWGRDKGLVIRSNGDDVLLTLSQQLIKYLSGYLARRLKEGR